MPTRLLHVSDLHFGAGDDPQRDGALAALIERVAPELVIASGDLTHRGRRDQHEHAAAFLRQLGPAVLAVPGNHDMPLNDKRATSVDIFATLDVPNIYIGRSEELLRIETRRGPVRTSRAHPAAMIIMSGQTR